MIKPLLATTFLFSFLFIFPAFAYLPTIINTTASMATTAAGIRCDNTYCYVASDSYLYRFNSTLGDMKTCANPRTGNPYGLLVINSTTAMVSFSSGMELVDITNIATGTCTEIRLNTSTSCKSANINIGDLDNSTNKTFWGYTGISNVENCDTAGTNYWSLLTGEYSFTYPNRSDNTTAWISVYPGHVFHKYVNSVETSSVANVSTLYGIAHSTGYPYYSIVKVNATTSWIYILQFAGGSTHRLYKANWTVAENIGSGTTITATSPINNQSISAVMQESVQLTVALTTYNNGTISFYNDGIWIGNTSITANYSSTSYFSTPVLADGQHYWNATFYDIYGNNWSTGNQTYFKEATSAITTVGQSLANALGVSLDYGKMMLALLISAALSGALAYYVKWQLFLPSMIICVFFFAVAGFFPAWFTLVFVVVGGVLFAKYSGLV